MNCLLLQCTPMAKTHTLLLFPFLAVGKNNVVQLSIVRCQISQQTVKSGSKKSHTKRSSLQDCYRRTEVWALQDLTLIDGRDPDVVINQILLYHCLLLHHILSSTKGMLGK